jgi:large subunit ribosomal protein L21
MTYAIIQLAGKQYKVSPGDTIIVSDVPNQEGEEFNITDVLLVADDKKTNIGTPLVKDAVVTAKVQKHQRGEKIRVATYRSKSRYRRVKGHRQEESVIEVLDIKA